MFSYTSPQNHKLHLCPYFISDDNATYSHCRPPSVLYPRPPAASLLPHCSTRPFSLQPFPPALPTSCPHVCLNTWAVLCIQVCRHASLIECRQAPSECQPGCFFRLPDPIRPLLSFIIPPPFPLPICRHALPFPSSISYFLPRDFAFVVNIHSPSLACCVSSLMLSVDLSLQLYIPFRVCFVLCFLFSLSFLFSIFTSVVPLPLSPLTSYFFLFPCS